jgi:hypothetical protein
MTPLQVVFILDLPNYKMAAAQTHVGLPHLPQIGEGVCFEIDGTITPDLLVTKVTYRLLLKKYVEICVDGSLLKGSVWLERIKNDPNWGTTH